MSRSRWRRLVVRAYNSKLAEQRVGGAFGRGWTHNYEARLSFLPGSVIKLRQPDGSPLFFEDPNATQTYAAMLPKTETSWIVKSGGTYTREFRTGGSETYDASGLLTSLTDAAGNVTTLTRDSSGNLASGADPGGRTISFSYDSSGRITSLAARRRHRFLCLRRERDLQTVTYVGVATLTTTLENVS
jgi:YD repeat-containing protein